MRDLLRAFAAEGRTVFLSSHLMSEMEQTAERVVVIAAGRLVAETDVEALRRRAASVRVVAADPADGLRLAEALGRAGGVLGDGGRASALLAGGGAPTGADSRDASGSALLNVSGLAPAEVGRVALSAGIAVSELVLQEARLEESFLALTEAPTRAPRHAPTTVSTGGAP
jgi:ABC-2 type transport system ATP-binding protein